MPYTIPEHIEIKATDGSTVAFLSPKSDGINNCWIDDEQNGSCTLEFELPLDNPKWQYLTDQYRIYAGDKEFVILNPDAVDKQRDGQKLKGKIKAHESWVLLGKKYATVCNDPLIGTPPWGAVIIVSGGAAHGGYDAGSAGSALSYLLQGTGWIVGTVDVTGTYDLETEKESVLYNINQVQEKWGGILIWDSVNKTVSLRDEATYKPYTGYQIRYAKNLKDINRVDDYDIVTRLYPFGENDLNIEAVNGGLLYLDNHSYSDDILEGVWYNQDIADQTQLKIAGEKQLAVMCRPRHNYKTEVLDLRSLPGYGHEAFKRSDMVDLLDEDFGTDAQVRIIRYRYNVFQPWLCDMELGDPLEKIAASVAQTVLMAKFYKNVVAPNTSFQNLLKAIINTEATEINGASGDYTLVDGVSTWFDRDSETGELTGKLLRITPQGLIISHDGGQTWKLAISGEGIHAEAGWVGKLNAGVVTIGADTTFEAGYDPTQIVAGSTVGMGVDVDCLGLWHFDGSLNSHKGVAAIGDANFDTGCFGQAAKVEEGTTNYLNGASDIASLYGGTVVTKPEVVSPCGDVVIEWTAGRNDDYTNFKGAVSCSAGEKVTVSIWARKISSSAHCEFYFSHDGTYHSSSFYPTLEWQRYSFTVTCTGTTTVSTRLDNNIQGDIVQFSGWQLEKKPYPTPFVDGTRLGVLKAPTTGLSPSQSAISLRAKNLSASANGSVLVDLPKSDNSHGIKTGISSETGHEGEIYISDSDKISKSYTETTQADFNSGILTDVVATSAGDLELAQTMNNALRFDGVDDYVQIANSTAISPTQAITVEAWILANTVTKQYMSAIDKPFTSATSPFFDYHLALSNDSCIRFRLATTEAKDTNPLVPGTWYHVAGTYDGSNIKLYVNGDLKATTPYTDIINASGMPLILGKALNYSGREWDGEIDDVRIWNVARTQNQIQDNMNKELVGNETGLVGYWKFNEDAGNTAYDSTVNANNGTIYGALRESADRVFSDFTKGKTYSSDSYEGIDKTASMAFDNNETTRWLSGGMGYPHWIQVDLGDGVTKIAKKLRFKPFVFNGASRVKNFKLQGSNNGASWTDIYVGLAENADNWQEFILSNSIGYRYYRIYGIDSYDTSQPNYMSIWEIEIFEYVAIRDYISLGTREKIVDLSGANPAGGTKIEWAKTTPTNTTVKVETALSTDGGSTYGAYQEATSGNSIPGIAEETDLSNARIKIRQTLSTTDTSVTPKLHSLSFTIWEKQATTVYGPNKSTLTGWDSISLAWKPERLSLVVNDEEACYIENPGLPASLGSHIFIGTDRNGANAINTLVDELRIDKVYREPNIRIGWHKTGVPFYTSEDMRQWPGYMKLETDGLKVYDSSDDLRVLVGSWVEDAIRKYGIRIIDGLIEASKIYGTSFQSGGKGATSYVRIGADFEPLEIKENGKTALNIWSSNGGMMQFYSTLLDNMMGQISVFDDVAGTGLRIHARNNAGSDRKLLLRGSDIDLDASGTTFVGNDLWVTGSIYSGSKSNVEVTANYGLRTLFVRESPNHKYILEGVSELVNGTCRIDIEPIFLECIEPNTVARWIVQLTPYAQASLWVSEIADTYFVVSSDIDQIEFAWTLSAYRKNFADIYLPEYVSKGVR